MFVWQEALLLGGTIIVKEAGGAVIDTSGGMLVLLSDLKNLEYGMK